MMILGIETSCDDTGVALVEARGGKFYVRKNVIISQAKLHNKYGGVVPELAARNHLKNIIPAVHEALGNTKPSALDAIAVTRGPGLVTSLHVGVETAKTLSLAWSVPLVGTNHMEGHIYSVLLPPPPVHRRGSGGGFGATAKIKFPAVALIVSGGHTELILMPGHGEYQLLGKTRDDAAGEAFDKAAFMLGLPYPGGPSISKAAEKGDSESFEIPRPMIERNDCEFSFSGMKNAIRLLVEGLKSTRHPGGRAADDRISANNPRDSIAANTRLQNDIVADLAASIQQAIVDILITKSLIAIAQTKPKTFILAGGVAANTELRTQLEKKLPKNTNLFISPLSYSQDNGAMIAVSAYRKIAKKQFDDPAKLTANAHWELV
ncbi:MAG: tRNA (adenosine(37)-N6)-threonylcarbamoyltransferase complex transferase subunit TsaD [Parcubacteria group bacterium]|nr:tRNA (adenosine(37)-N6)-threonylcarbamoyltransferase complex transferase subunit TsaD [Parcubacteria group bacterium]